MAASGENLLTKQGTVFRDCPTARMVSAVGPFSFMGAPAGEEALRRNRIFFVDTRTDATSVAMKHIRNLPKLT